MSWDFTKGGIMQNNKYLQNQEIKIKDKPYIPKLNLRERKARIEREKKANLKMGREREREIVVVK